MATGEISDTLIYAMAKAGADDGRKLIVFTISDFDPAGHQMPISIGRKLQAFRDLKFPDLSFEVHPIALTYEQVVEFDLPSEPLKETERRGNKWRDAWGRDQTEIDALIEMHPDALVEMIEDAVVPFYDSTLASRVDKAGEAWEAEARVRLDAVFDGSVLEPFEAEAVAVVERAKADLREIDQRAKATISGLEVELPPIPDLPEPDADGIADDLPLIDSDWSWIEQTKALIDHKRYGGEE